MSIWMNALSALFMVTSGTNPMADVPSPLVKPETHEPQSTGYVVVESVDDEAVVIETSKGVITIPRSLMPNDGIYEGAILEWRVADDEASRRLAEAKLRIERMKAMSQK